MIDLLGLIPVSYWKDERHKSEKKIMTDTKPLSTKRSLDVAVLLPCHNEELTIADVIKAFKKALPEACIYVYDNASTDRTADVALAAGAVVRTEHLVGKGNVVRRAFSDVEADVYVLADGDGTYSASIAPDMIGKLISENLDMVVGVRKADVQNAWRRGHRFGNMVANRLIRILFGGSFTDIWSGYRVMSRRFVKSFPAASQGFEIETEMAIHSMQVKIPCAEVETRYVERPLGSKSKLRTWQDGWLILVAIVMMVKEVCPFFFFGSASVLIALFSIWLAVPVFMTYFETGLVPRQPTVILCLGLGVIAVGSVMAGIVLDSLRRARYESKRLAFLSHLSVSNEHSLTSGNRG